MVLKAESNNPSKEDSDMAYLIRRFQKMVRRNGAYQREPGHFIKDCPLLKKEHFKHNSNKASKRNLVPYKRFKRKNVADNVVKQALAAWGDSSNESDEENDASDSSIMVVEGEANKYDSIFSLMAQSDNDEDDDNDEVNFKDVQRNLKSHSPTKLMSLANALIDVYHSLVDDKDALIIELGDAEQTRDDLVVCIVDLKETIGNLENEKDVLTKKIASVEHERDDLMVVVVDLKETTENFSKKKNDLVEKVDALEQERDDILVVIIDLREIIEELKAECRPGNSEKGKKELEKVKNDLEKYLKWTWSSDAITTMYVNNGGNGQGIGFQRERTPYNPHSKCVIVPDNWLCTHCGINGHFKKKLTIQDSVSSKKQSFC
ncbi:uncharacterized protein [Nicotiana sylvestris]|uniref:uncharacterized protein n=1 Tax=Nicotiana sylvestris TaxID=4096 RepID=UPI00388CB058